MDIGIPVLIVLVGSRLLKFNTPASDWDFMVASVYPDLLLSFGREDRLELYRREITLDINIGEQKVELKVWPIEKLFESIATFSPASLEPIIAISHRSFIPLRVDGEALVSIIKEIPAKCLALATAEYAYSFTKRYLRALEHHEKRALEAIKLLLIYSYMTKHEEIPPPDIIRIAESVDSLSFIVPPYTKTLKEAIIEYIEKRRRGEPPHDWSVDIILRTASRIHNIFMKERFEIKKEATRYCKEEKNMLREKLNGLYRDIIPRCLSEEGYYLGEVVNAVIHMIKTMNNQ